MSRETAPLMLSPFTQIKYWKKGKIFIYFYNTKLKNNHNNKPQATVSFRNGKICGIDNKSKKELMQKLNSLHVR